MRMRYNRCPIFTILIQINLDNYRGQPGDDGGHQVIVLAGVDDVIAGYNGRLNLEEWNSLKKSFDCQRNGFSFNVGCCSIIVTANISTLVL